MKLTNLSEILFSPAVRKTLGRYTLYIAILSFFSHLILYFLYHQIWHLQPTGLLSNPINAIYTPFSFLLVYEAYLLLYYLQQSTTIYVAKQYEIIVLILIRGVFKDMTHLELKSHQLFSPGNLELWYDLITAALLFSLILLFYRITGRLASQSPELPESGSNGENLLKFIQAKKYLATILLLVSFGIGVHGFTEWWIKAADSGSWFSDPDVNAIFFDDFFTILIMTDVLILLFSLFYSDDFPVIIRNSSFIISTILLKLSFSADTGMSQILMLAGVGFGVVMSAITQRYSLTLKRNA